MMVKCPKCGQKHCISHREVLAAARKLHDRAQRGQVPADATSGNVLDPDDEKAKRLRDEAIRNRLGNHA